MFLLALNTIGNFIAKGRKYLQLISKSKVVNLATTGGKQVLHIYIPT